MAAPIKLPRDLLLEASRNINAELGLLEDLPDELRNTIANIYFRSCELRRRVSSRTGDEAFVAGDHPATLQAFMRQSSQVLADRKFIGELIHSVRGALQADRKAFEYLVVLTLDLMKYKIEDAQNKSRLRRAIERKFKKPDEYPGLYITMQSVARRDAEESSDNRADDA